MATMAVHRELDALELRVAQLLQVASGKTFPDLAAPEPGAPCVPQPTVAAQTGPSQEVAPSENETILDDDVEGEIVKVCAVPRPLLRIGLLSFIVLLIGVRIPRFVHTYTAVLLIGSRPTGTTYLRLLQP